MARVIYVHSIHSDEISPRVLGHLLKNEGYLVRDGRYKTLTRSDYFEQIINRWDAYVIDAHRGSVTSQTTFELFLPDGRFFDRVKNDLLALEIINTFIVFDRRLNGTRIGGRRYSIKNGYRREKETFYGSPRDSIGRQYLRWMRLGHRYMALEMHTNNDEILKRKNVLRVTKLMHLLSKLND